MFSSSRRLLCSTGSSVLKASSRKTIVPPVPSDAAAAARWASTLVVSDTTTSDGIAPATQAAVTAATQFQTDEVVLLTAGSEPPSEVPAGVTQIYHVATTGSSGFLSHEHWAQAIQNAVTELPDCQAVVGVSTKTGSSVIPRAAALLNASPLSDVLQILDGDTFLRSMYAGNAIAKVQTRTDSLKVLTVRPTTFDKAPLTTSSSVPVTELALVLEDTVATAFVSANVSQSDRPDLTSARVVVSGGRGMKEGSNFAMLETLVDSLAGNPSEGAVGASRAAVDAGMVPNDWQVGQTGKVVAPDLYVAVGISGAIQHLSGMKDSKTIVAINQDPDAPIFQVADYGLQSDLFQAVPELSQKLGGK